MFERFTDRARRVLVLAQEEARSLGHSHIDTAHELLGMALEGEGIGGRALLGLGATPEAIRRALLTRLPPGGHWIDPGEALASIGIDLGHVQEAAEHAFGEGALKTPQGPPFTDDAKEALNSALKAALDLGNNYIGTEHLGLGILAAGGSATDVLDDLGISGESLRGAILLPLDTNRRLLEDLEIGPLVADWPGWLEIANLLPPERVNGAREAIISTYGAAVGAATSAALQSPPGSDANELRQHYTGVASARLEANDRLRDLGVLSFLDTARRLMEHPRVAPLEQRLVSLGRGKPRVAEVDANRLRSIVLAQRAAGNARAKAWADVWERHDSAGTSDEDLASAFGTLGPTLDAFEAAIADARAN